MDALQDRITGARKGSAESRPGQAHNHHADELWSPKKHHLVLHRIDPEQGIRRLYFADDRAGSVWDELNGAQLGKAPDPTGGREKVEEFASEIEAGKALAVVAPGEAEEGGTGICEVAKLGVTYLKTKLELIP